MRSISRISKKIQMVGWYYRPVSATNVFFFFNFAVVLIQVIYIYFCFCFVISVLFICYLYKNCISTGVATNTVFRYKTNCNDLNFNCFYVCRTSKPFGELVNF